MLEASVLFIGGGMLIMLFEAILLAIHWILMPFTWLPILLWVLFKCDSYYIENLFFFPVDLLTGSCYKTEPNTESGNPDS